MGTEHRRQLLLAALAIALAAVVYQAWPRTSAAPAAASNQRRAAAPATAGTSGTNANAANQTATPVAPDVNLEALEAERPKPGAADRNLFRFKPKAPPPPSTTTKPVLTGPVAPIPTGPPPPPPVPPITLKFIGVADPGAGKSKIAVLSDGLGPPVSAPEGAVVFGRYRILKIGVESIEMAYLDGRGRQTIRLSGS